MNCKLCSEPMVPVIYGYPTPSQIEDARNDKMVLGGLPSKNHFMPSHYCYACQEQYPTPDDPYDNHNYTPFGL
jgi:hypothetical protein